MKLIIVVIALTTIGTLVGAAPSSKTELETFGYLPKKALSPGPQLPDGSNKVAVAQQDNSHNVLESINAAEQENGDFKTSLTWGFSQLHKMMILLT